MIRKSFATIAILALLLTAGAAQAEGFFGLQAGANFGNMGGDMDEVGDALADELELELGGVWTASKKGRQAPAGGVYYTVMQHSGFGVQFEANYVSRGARFDIASGGVQMKAHLKFNYLEIPVLFRYQPAPGEKKQIVFLAGPVVGFKMSPKMMISGVGAPDVEGDLEGVKGTTLGVTGAIAFRFAFNEKHALQVQTRYHKGITNAIDDREFESTAQDFTILAGMEFALGQ